RANKARYVSQANAAAEMFLQWVARRVVENWGDDVPKVQTTDIQRAVQASDDDVIVFSCIVFPDKATRDAVQKRMMDDPDMMQVPEMPFDGKRMIFGGFANLFKLG